MFIHFWSEDKNLTFARTSFVFLAHLLRVQQSADVFQKLLVLDLGVREKERRVQIRSCGLLHDRLQVLVPFADAVPFRRLHLVKVVAANMGR